MCLLSDVLFGFSIRMLLMEYWWVWLDWINIYLFWDVSHKLALPRLVLGATVISLSGTIL